ASHLAESRERRRVALANEVLEERVRERTQEVLEREFEVIYRLGQAVESRDEETGGHIERMSQLCGRLALAAGMDAEEADMVRRASAVHDVGKIGVPDSILRRAGALDEGEWEIMKAHTTMGAAMLSGSRSALIRLAETIALTHHERWDGSGYPAGLAGEEIPLVGRICAICDTFDALVSERPYKPAWPLAMALEEIRSQSGAQFDPHLVGLFLAMDPGAAVGDGAQPVAGETVVA
ncbi:MAG TPA: HD domain-containing phosphohydrolase, partial [Thermoleophilaceae bacterium]|nr:HD domain-containing phosphohydrolase [Thermoleophilaceae bacterium]